VPLPVARVVHKEKFLGVVLGVVSEMKNRRRSIHAGFKALYESHRPANNIANFSEVCLKTPRKSNAWGFFYVCSAQVRPLISLFFESMLAHMDEPHPERWMKMTCVRRAVLLCRAGRTGTAMNGRIRHGTPPQRHETCRGMSASVSLKALRTEII
jgi:hypothetical protein